MNYDNVEVYSPGTKVRYTANKKWKSNLVDAPEFEPGSPEWLAKKDKIKHLLIMSDESCNYQIYENL